MASGSRSRGEHLFGGERGLVRDIRRRFERIGLTTRIAIAPTAAAAWALARFSPLTSRSSLSGARLFAVAPLPRGERDLAAAPPVAALRLDADTLRTLERLGLKTVGALLEVPRLALARRFRGAEDVVDALDRALGRKPEPLTAAPVEQPPRALLKLEEPATHPEAASQALDRLVPMLVRLLGARRLGARRLSLTGFRVDGSVGVASVATSIPSREPKHLQRLLADKTAALDPEFGFDAFALTADWTEDLGAAQDSLVEEPSGERELARLVDRLTVKLGPRAVRRPQAVESHLPERASGWVGAISLAPPPSAGEGLERGEEASFTPSPFRRFAAPSLPRSGGRGLRSAPSACSTGRRRSTSFMRRPKACPGGSCGVVPSMTLRGWKDRNGSRRNGGASRPRRGCAIITGSRMPPAAATGSTAKA